MNLWLFRQLTAQTTMNATSAALQADRALAMLELQRKAAPNAQDKVVTALSDGIAQVANVLKDSMKVVMPDIPVVPDSAVAMPVPWYAQQSAGVDDSDPMDDFIARHLGPTEVNDVTAGLPGEVNNTQSSFGIPGLVDPDIAAQLAAQTVAQTTRVSA